METEVLIALVAGLSVAVGAAISGGTALLAAWAQRKAVSDQWEREAVERDRNRFHADRLAAYAEMAAALDAFLLQCAHRSTGTEASSEAIGGALQRVHTAQSRLLLLSHSPDIGLAVVETMEAVNAVGEAVYKEKEAWQPAKERMQSASLRMVLIGSRELGRPQTLFVPEPAPTPKRHRWWKRGSDPA